MDPGLIRNEYKSEAIDQGRLPEHPLELFKEWLTAALESGENEPAAMVLSTVGADGSPESRVVLLKSLENGGFSFFTSYQSPKGISIEKNRNVSLVFFWPGMYRQVRVKGIAEKAPTHASDAYFASRPVESQISAWASAQSSWVESREELEEKYRAFKKKFGNNPVPRPKHWGGYFISPVSVEFWQGRERRLHDRFLYEKEKDSWTVRRLSP